MAVNFSESKTKLKQMKSRQSQKTKSQRKQSQQNWKPKKQKNLSQRKRIQMGQDKTQELLKEKLRGKGVIGI